MKIVHICLAGSYNDGWSYQDNLLSQYHKELGNEVSIITTPFVNGKRSEEYEYFKVGEYINEFGIKIVRIPLIVSKKNKIIMKLRMYKGTFKAISKESPDVLFVHGVQFWDIRKVIKYKKNNPNVRLYIDNHADFSNSAKGWFSYHIIHKILWKSGAQKAIPFTEKFYGVLPSRVDFLKIMYKVPKDMIELLVMGADDQLVGLSRKEESIKKYKKKYHIEEGDFVIVTGGKIDSGKSKIVNLLEYITNSNDIKVKLIVFGPIIDDMKDKILPYFDNHRIQYFQWLDNADTYGLFAVANLAVFPGGHSVYWEQAVGSGLPIMVKYWNGATHVDLGGNCVFLKLDTYEELKSKLDSLLANPEEYLRMKEASIQKGIDFFSYRNISVRSLS